MLKQQIDQDLKAALLAGDKARATVLRGIKSVILYEEVAKGIREDGLADEAIIGLLAKEAKKRQESADLYQKGGDDERAQAELSEKNIIEHYLPKQLTDGELSLCIDKAMASVSAQGPQHMGGVIAAVKQQVGGRADGARIARMVKERLG